eukprot:TRINITY_DN1090_c0_g1_i3.p3 TRINITY_DN1090_c0_g1~~TRINITY_DN1090_c0_g1_i3.p3  ORF type:complete len:126 (-),score=32.75 TRINITY_DN1090_c0_g1_i3:935-1312(-)
MHEPTSLLRYDQPVSAEDEGALNLQSKLWAAKLQDKGLGNVPTGDDILHTMLPPREYEEDGYKYVQRVSTQAASRFDVITLQEHLDRRMAERKARESGICVVREQLYSQCFGTSERCRDATDPIR